MPYEYISYVRRKASLSPQSMLRSSHGNKPNHLRGSHHVRTHLPPRSARHHCRRIHNLRFMAHGRTVGTHLRRRARGSLLRLRPRGLGNQWREHRPYVRCRMSAATIHAPRFTFWCSDCDGPATEVWCAMTDGRECGECHAYIECPCGDDL